MFSVIFPYPKFTSRFTAMQACAVFFSNNIFTLPRHRAAMRSIQPLRLVTGFARRFLTQSSKSAGSDLLAARKQQGEHQLVHLRIVRAWVTGPGALACRKCSCGAPSACRDNARLAQVRPFTCRRLQRGFLVAPRIEEKAPRRKASLRQYLRPCKAYRAPR